MRFYYTLANVIKSKAVSKTRLAPLFTVRVPPGVDIFCLALMVILLFCLLVWYRETNKNCVLPSKQISILDLYTRECQPAGIGGTAAKTKQNKTNNKNKQTKTVISQLRAGHVSPHLALHKISAHVKLASKTRTQQSKVLILDSRKKASVANRG